MARLLYIVPLLGLIAVPVCSYLTFSSPPSLPDLDLNETWGNSGDENDTSIRPFEIVFGEEMLADLTERLNKSCNFTAPLEGADVGFNYGFNTDTLGEWLKYWGESYPFSERQTFFNQFPHYKTRIQDLDIHFIHVKPEVSDGVEVVPLLMVHGWPGSVREFYEAIPLLTAVSETRTFALEIIAPSLPGFGFSDPAIRPGLGAVQISVVLRNLMHRLGHEQYYVHGEDWGSIICSHLVTMFPEEVLGHYTNMPYTSSSTTIVNQFIYVLNPSLVDSEASNITSTLTERLTALQSNLANILQESGYMHMQATKPDTIGIALSDSPAGLLAYILEKFATATTLENRDKVDGGLNLTWTKDQLIDNLMMYWAPKSITTSMRLYAETLNSTQQALGLADIPTSVPTWITRGKNELLAQSEFIYKYKYPNLLNFTILNDYGHFLAFEVPEIFSEDVLRAVTQFRSLAQETVKTEL